MQTELLNVAFDNTVQDAINRLKEGKANGKLENIHQLFVTGVYDRLLLAIPLEDLITLDFETSFRDLFPAENEKFRPRYIHDDEDIQKVASLFEEYDLSVIAVTDYYGKLLGRITSDDIYDIMQERSTEQLYHLAGLDDEAEEEDNLLEAGKKRGSWLFINLLTAILASIVIGMFDETLQKYVALAILMPIVASMGGNAGTQTLTVVVRQLALGVIRIEDARSTIKKEVFLSFGNGIIFSLLMGSIAYFWFNEPLIGLVIAMSMVVNLLFAGFFGAIIPLLLKRFHIDPAVGSTVLLTTVTDVVGFLSFLGFAKLILV
jgi:magnesium transporter